MAFFSKKLIDQLFIGEDQADDRGFIAFVTPKAINPPNDTIELSDALQNTSYNGSFVFSALAPSIETEAEATTFVEKINALTAQSSANRAIIWLEQIDIDQINPNNSSMMGLNSDGSQLSTGLQATLVSGLYLNLQSGIQISLDTTTNVLSLDGRGTYKLGFSGPNAPQTNNVYFGTLNFSGSLRGCIQFGIFIQRSSLMNDLQWGFQFLIPENNGSDEDSLGEWLPFGTSTPSGDLIGFNSCVDPSDVINSAFDPCKDNGSPCSISASYASRRTFFDFIGKNQSEQSTTISSYFTSNFGTGVTLVPKQTDTDVLNARLVISKGEVNLSKNTEEFHFAPEGDFEIQFDQQTTSEQYYLLCGLQGTEFFKLSQTGDSIRFISKQAAFAPKFPFEAASSVQAPEDPTASLLDDVKETSWVTLLNTSGNAITYVSQPKGSALFGDGGSDFKYDDLFAHSTMGFTYTANDTTLFPMVPYLGLTPGNGVTAFTSSQTETFESQILSQTRRGIIGAATTNSSLIAAAQVLGNGQAATSTTSTTPSGLLAKTTESDGQLQWNEIFLGQNTDAGTQYIMEFVNPQNELVEALQTSDLFLVAANADYLGAFNGTGAGEASFKNSMSIDSWELQANVGKGSEYNNYKNIMIVKGRKGKLYDPNGATDSLVANPKKWTQRNLFASPSTIDSKGDQQPPDPDQQVILSQWLQSYFEQSYAQSDNEYFTQFNTIATDENWTGILVLRMDIQNLPTNLQGITAGITDPEAFNAHHFAIEISPVKKGDGGAVVDQPSTMFGLIYYVDPDFDDSNPNDIQPIAPTTSATYDFRLLSLKVLFENTAVKNFDSYAQLTLNKLFDSQVTSMQDPENIFKNVLLTGSFQINNGNAVYSLGSVKDNTFLFDSNIYNKIEITDVLLTTRNSGVENVDESWFAMQGFIDYKIVKNTDQSVFDIFSFGSASDDNLTPRTGLNFNNLGIEMTYDVDNPQQSKQLSFNATEITFDLTTSTPRTNSLYTNFALDLEGLLIGSSDKSPQDQGYLDVISDARLSGVSGTDWYGLNFKLSMGTPGELAGKVSLNSFLVLSWGPDSSGDDSYQANIGISLPGTGGGAKLISLQTVLKLSIGQIKLVYDPTGGYYKSGGFLLMFTEIALKFLGLLKIPPNGSSLFYLFGNPQSQGNPSGLGWYAMYKQDSQQSTESAKAEVEAELIQ